jgi:hypothetical protein
MDQSNRAGWERQFRDAVQPKVDEPVLAVGLFHRTAGYALGGLPLAFLIAVTPTRIHAFECSQGSGGVTAGDEVAVWQRAGLVVTAEEAGVATKVTIDGPAGGERVVCSTGRDELSRSVVRAMQEPAGTPVGV